MKEVSGKMTFMIALLFACVGSVEASADDESMNPLFKSCEPVSKNPDSSTGPPQPIPVDILRESNSYKQKRDKTAAIDISRASQMAMLYIEENKKTLGNDHWFLSVETHIHNELIVFQSFDADTQVKLKEAIRNLTQAEKEYFQENYAISKQLLLEKSLPVFEEYAKHGVYHLRAIDLCAMNDFMNGSYESAKKRASLARALAGNIFGKDHVQYAEVSMVEGSIDFRLNDYESAEIAFQRASRIAEKYCTKQIALLGFSSAYLTVLYLKEGEKQKAFSLAKETTERSVVYGLPNNADVQVTQLCVVAAKLMSKQRYLEAQVVFDELFRIAENPASPSPARSLVAYYELQVANYKNLDRPLDVKMATQKLEVYKAKSSKMSSD